ncbi:hypothetical protein F0562_007456 [Nyssa sinensis]|uniref:WRKY domain-containing protein n=1 Tax=Nyssa sinensis TaxID=561372 RepID=A0A5J5A850_9ASTE|nr:hypothetical protein F0562_007456 [Nyssa sinensis]
MDDHETLSHNEKVQRCMEDQSVLSVTYEGEHNHEVHSSLGSSKSSVDCSINGSTAGFPSPATVNPLQSAISLDLTLSGASQETAIPSQSSMESNNSTNIEEYVASLAKDPNFTAALAAAVARSINIEQSK